jgi:nucleotide-binding universal stress UspA family protein
MPEIRRILCPTDFSDASRHALDHAVMLAGWYRARITALHVRHPAFLVEPPVLLNEFDAPIPTLEEAEARLHDWLAPVRAAGLHCDVVAVDSSRPAAAIVDTAERTGTDLIALGTHGRSGFERVLLGSVTERVVRTTRCPVITVPPPAAATSSLPFRRVLCAIDFSEPSLAALELAMSIALESRSALTVLHVIEFPQESQSHVFTTLPFDMDAYRAAVQADATRRLNSLVPDEVREYCQPVTKITTGKAYEQILHVASDGHADLIVLGVHGRNALGLMLFGSTTNQVIRRATCPVLTLNR